jgi:hypothetical protein
MWAAGETSAFNIAFNMSPFLRDLLDAEGIQVAETERLALCEIPRHFIDTRERRRARVVHIHKHDANRFAAEHIGRVKRTRIDLEPMDVVAADVRHCDILVPRADGSLTTAKMVAFLDLATNRYFVRVEILPKGKMVRREHVLMTLRDMMADPSWGVPRILYLDNGSEFNIGLTPGDLGRISKMVRDFHKADAKPALFRDYETDAGIVNSLPYNPQSKIIETGFSVLTRSVEPIYGGYVGGNRMAKKTQNQGRLPKPMEGDEANLKKKHAEMIEFLNARRHQNGVIKGKSPNQVFTEFVKNGWQSVICNPHELELAFTTDKTATVQKGGEIRCDSRFYYEKKLTSMIGERVTIGVPIIGARTTLNVMDDKRQLICVAHERQERGIFDPEGVKASGQFRRDAKAEVRRLAADLPKVDLPKARAAAVAALPKPPVPSPLASVSYHPMVREAAAEAHRMPDPPERLGQTTMQQKWATLRKINKRDDAAA